MAASSATGSAATSITITCSASGAIAWSRSQECGLDDWVSAAAKRHGFVATDHRVEIVGLCADCR